MTDTRRAILILEDEMIVAMDLQMQLEDAGWRVIGPAGTVTEADHVLDGESPVFALLDVNVGDETSFALAKRLSNAGTKVIFLTGKTRGMLPKGLNAMRVLQKPLQRDELLRVIGCGSGASVAAP